VVVTVYLGFFCVRPEGLKSEFSRLIVALSGLGLDSVDSASSFLIVEPLFPALERNSHQSLAYKSGEIKYVPIVSDGCNPLAG